MKAPGDQPSISATLLSQLFLYLSSQGMDGDQVLQAAGVEPAAVVSPDSYISAETYTRIHDEAARQSGDPCFGLHMGSAAQPASWSILGYLMMNCRTLGEAFEKSNRYYRIIGNQIATRVRPSLSTVRVVFYSPQSAAPPSAHCYEAAVASSVRIMRTLTGRRICPREVTFPHRRPEPSGEHERFYGCPVRFDERRTSMTFDANLAHTPILMPNAALRRRFEEYARDLLETLENGTDCADQAARVILARLDDPSLSVRTVAKDMAMSARTLQKRLGEEGVAFRRLLRDTREALAKRHLLHGRSVEEITYLLGYSDPSAFRKAFRKWTGSTPREYRNTAVQH